MNFVQSIKSGFKNYFNCSGRASRSEYWNWKLMQLIIVIANAVFSPKDFKFDIGIIFLLLLILPTIMLSIRRLHDTGKTGWLLMISFLPIIGALVLLILYIMKGDEQDNEYGKNPLQDLK